MPPSFFIVANALLSVDFGEDAFVGLGLELDPCGPENVDDRTGGDFGFDGLGLTDFTGVTGSDTGDFGGGGLEAGKKEQNKQIQTNSSKLFSGTKESVVRTANCFEIGLLETIFMDYVSLDQSSSRTVSTFSSLCTSVREK